MFILFFSILLKYCNRWEKTIWTQSNYVNNNVCLSLDEKKTIWTPCTPWIWDSSKVPLSQWLYSYLEGYELKNKQATVRLIDILSPLDLECHQAWLHLAWGGEACLGLLLLDLIFTIWKTNIYGYTWVYSR